MIHRSIFLPLLLLLAAVLSARAQEPITFMQLAERIDPYFAPELV